MAVTSREELKEYCLRRLGYPVIDINVADQQLEDLIDTSVQYFNEWHCEGAEKLFTKHTITGSTLVFASAAPSSFVTGKVLTGGTSGATTVIHSIATDRLSATVFSTVGTFVTGETVTNIANDSVALAASSFYTAGDLDNRYIVIPSNVMSIVKIFPFNAGTGSNFLFDPAYYFMYESLYSFGNLDLVGYEMMKERINLINFTLVGSKPIRFSRYTEKLHIDWDWMKNCTVGTKLLIECWAAVDPESNSSAWNDFFLKAYTTAQFKLQWGENISKFVAIQLPGGVTLDGPRLIAEAKEEIAALEEQMKNGRWSAPIGPMIG